MRWVALSNALRRRQRRNTLTRKIEAIHEASGQGYGSPRVHAELCAQGERCCCNAVAKLMRAASIMPRCIPRFREEISTIAALTSNPAFVMTSASASAFSYRRSASSVFLPALTRRATVRPIKPAPMTTTTLLMAILLFGTPGI